ncbi:hypothetical protein [Bacillus benzoevorans]|uniref:Uncharacterized protein n=1 Tax=Bacillus benzoevorans TaxID=1456 RepID=A0A7X0HXU7_9BACI|nr:hypothetical protein [Bacillus benzoevorans]
MKGKKPQSPAKKVLHQSYEGQNAAKASQKGPSSTITPISAKELNPNPQFPHDILPPRTHPIPSPT